MKSSAGKDILKYFLLLQNEFYVLSACQFHLVFFKKFVYAVTFGTKMSPRIICIIIYNVSLL